MDLRILLFSFRGRINRAKYWLAILVYAGAALLFGLVAGIVMTGVRATAADALTGAGLTLVAIFILFLVGGTWSGFAVAIKRLHDREKSGWMLLLFWGVPGLLNVIARSWAIGGGMVFAVFIGLVSAAISIWGFVEIACLKGTAGPNDYGPDPLVGPTGNLGGSKDLAGDDRPFLSSLNAP
jgi:uncharacterized membrane protein YhaH (DUF805 family)